MAVPQPYGDISIYLRLINECVSKWIPQAGLQIARYSPTRRRIVHFFFSINRMDNH